MRVIFNQVNLETGSEVIKLAVLGCGDRRFIKGHKIIFDKVLQKPVEVITFDITIDHLQGENRITRHDCTLPLPNPPYDITYAHVLLKFIETEKQWDLIKNSYEALKSGGLAIHLLDKEDYETTELRLIDGYYSVPLRHWEEKLTNEGVDFVKIPVKYGIALVIKKK